MTRTFADAAAFVLGEEGQDTNDPADPGGLTRFGIAQNRHANVDVASLTRDQAVAIYRDQYWAPLSLDSIPYFLALPIFDAAVNQGVGLAAQTLQRALNVPIDGKIGGVTIAMARIAAPATLDLFMSFRALAYTRDTQFPTDGRGWITRCFRVARTALQT